MKTKLLVRVAAAALTLTAYSAAQAAAPKPTAAEAIAFVTKAEADLAKANSYAAKAAWVRATYITEDTQWLEAKAGAEQNELATGLAMQAARYNGVKLDPVNRRKLELLKRSLVLPAPIRPGAADRLATLASKLDSTYSTGKFTHQGKTLTLNDAEKILASSRDPNELKLLLSDEVQQYDARWPVAHRHRPAPPSRPACPRAGRSWQPVPWPRGPGGGP